MATWTANAPTKDAAKEVTNRLGLGTSGGTAGATFANVSWAGNKRAVLTRIIGAGTYTSGGDAITPALFGLREIHSITGIGIDANGVQAMSGGALIASPGVSPKLRMLNGATEFSGSATTLDFHALVVGV